jgi:protein-disulfide isomerase
VKRSLPFFLVAFVLLITCGVATLLFHSRQHPPPALPLEKMEAKPGAEPAHVRGWADARVTLEEFGDFECAPCGNLSPILEKLEQDYGTRLRVVFREYPLPAHPHAFAAASAAEAAGRQGRFWEMHDLLYHNRFVWPGAPDIAAAFADYATKIGLDGGRFTRDRDSEEVKKRIRLDQERAISLDVKETPTLFINGTRVPPTSLNPDGLRQAIDTAL